MRVLTIYCSSRLQDWIQSLCCRHHHKIESLINAKKKYAVISFRVLTKRKNGKQKKNLFFANVKFQLGAITINTVIQAVIPALIAFVSS